MAGSKDSTSTSGWKAEVDMLPVASEMEFLRWFYLNADAKVRAELVSEFHRTEQKALPENLR
ncbi:hypothetical protein I5I61_28420 [Pseudomonas nitroreducens]|uniref:Uncharacterized protein n=1 Tax=Pseudomonas nitroreducens TaxID=46680 RepID=A0ABS0KTI9_PSENT|nr:hypothetical protein [Pseudomonas nitroreducens]MBG6291400.1 hypothetical protein [Pseudomonas nitroreducens]